MVAEMEKPVVIDKAVHARLVQDAAGVCEIAGVQKRFLYSSMSEHCSAEEMDYVRCFKKLEAKGVPGMILAGVSHPDTRCQAIAAALLRNFVDARVIPLNTLLEDEGGVEPHVLLIPNAYVAAASTGKAMPSYRIQQLYDLLMTRAVRGKSTILYVEDMAGVKSTYGAPFADFLTGFKLVS